MCFQFPSAAGVAITETRLLRGQAIPDPYAVAASAKKNPAAARDGPRDVEPYRGMNVTF